MHCPHCTNTIPDGSRFCLNCGSSLSGLSGSERAGSAPLQRVAVSDGGESGPYPVPVDSAPWADSLGDRKTIGAALNPAAARSAAALPQVPLIERYEVLNEVGRGGFGIVYQARDKKLDRIVAVKRLLMNQLSGTQRSITLDRFEREARAIAGLNHRHIVQVFDHDQDVEGHYIVMEYVSGGTLAAYLRREKRLSVDEALDLVKGICQGLGFAHRRNLVHRDIKPANILLSEDEGRLVAKIVDFGLARQGGGSEVSISGYGLGTPWYMPPEQRRDAKNVNHTADIYALGKTLYEMVTGEIPDNVDPELIPPPPVLSRVILKCLKSNPEDRYFSMEELLADLERVQSGASTSAPAAMPAGQAMAKNVCPTCNTANGDDVKFCEQCGSGLYRSCPECDRENSVHKKFCGSCGTEVEGFGVVAGILQKIEQYRQEKRWSRVLKEADLVPPKLQLPKAKGQQKLQSIGKLQDEARQKIARCDQTRKLIDEACEQQEFEKALELVGQFREIDPHDAAVNSLLDRLPQDIARQKDERAWEAASTDAGRLVKDAEFESAAEALHAYLKKYSSGEFVDAAREELRRVRRFELKHSMRQIIGRENAQRLRELIEEFGKDLGSDDEVEQWATSLPEWEDDWAWNAARNAVLEKSSNFDDAGALAAAAETIRQFLTRHESSRHADEARSEWERLVRMELHRRLHAAMLARDAAQIEQLAADAKRLLGEDSEIESAASDLPNLIVAWDWQETIAEAEESLKRYDLVAAAAAFSSHARRHPESSHAAEALQRATKHRRDEVRTRLNAAIKTRNADEASRIVDEWRDRFGVTEDIEQFAASLPQRRDDWDWENARREVAVWERGHRRAENSDESVLVLEKHESLAAALEVVQKYCRTHPESTHLDAAEKEIERLTRAELLARLNTALRTIKLAEAFRLAGECQQLQFDAPEVVIARSYIPWRFVEELLQLSTPQAGELVAWFRQHFGNQSKASASESQPIVDSSAYQAIRQSAEQYLEKGINAVLFAETFQFAEKILGARILKERLDEAVRGGVPEKQIRPLLDLFSGRLLDFSKAGPSAAYFVGIQSWVVGPRDTITSFVSRAQEDRANFRRLMKQATSKLMLGIPQGPTNAAGQFKTYLNENAFGAYVTEAQMLLKLFEGRSENNELGSLLVETDNAVVEARLFLHAYRECTVRKCVRRAEEHLKLARQIRDAFPKASRHFQAIDRAIRQIAGDAAADVVDPQVADRREFRAAVGAAAEAAHLCDTRSATAQFVGYLTRFPKGRFAVEAGAYILNHGGTLPVADPPQPPKPAPAKPGKSPEPSDSDEFELSLEDSADSGEFELALDDSDDSFDIFETDFEVPALEDSGVISLELSYESVEACEAAIYIELAGACQKNNQMPRAREHLASAESLLTRLSAKHFDRQDLQRLLNDVKRKIK